MERAAELYREHERLVRAICERMVGASDAEDIVQDAFVRALTRPPADQTQPIRPWLLKVARNLAIDHLRRRKRVDGNEPTEPMLEDTTDEEPQETPEDIAELRERGVAAVLVACEALPPTERGVVLLRDLLELSTRETASVLGLSDGSVKVLHLRARKTLAQRPDVPAGPMGPSTIDALERFVRWLTARELAGIPVRAQSSTDWDGMAEPALSSAAVLSSQTAVLQAIVEAARQSDRPALLARALLCRGNLWRLAGHFEPACDDLREARDLAERTGEGELAVRAHSLLASTFVALGQDGPAAVELSRALGSASLRDTGEEGALRCRLAELLVQQGRRADARAELEIVSGLLRSNDDKRARLRATNQAGHQALASDDYAAAMARWTESLELCRRLGDRRSECTVRANLGVTWLTLRDPSRAREELWRSVALARELDVARLEAAALMGIALVEQDERALDMATVRYEQANALFRSSGSRRLEGVSLFNSGVCALLRRRLDRAQAAMAAGRALISDGGPDLMDTYMQTFEAAALLVAGDPEGLPALARIRGETDGLRGAAAVLAAIPLVHGGDPDGAREVLRQAVARSLEMRTAIHLVENELAAHGSHGRRSEDSA